MSGDRGGNTLSQATLISGTNALNLRDQIGRRDRNDFYRFTLNNRSSVALSLNGLRANADLTLLNAAGQTIGQSQRPSRQSEAISQTLDPGTYYVRIYPNRRTDFTAYRFSLSATEIPAPPTAYRYEFTYFYGNGDYYKGYGFTGDASYSAGRVITADRNETGLTGYYQIHTVTPTLDLTANQQIYVTQYYDAGNVQQLFTPASGFGSGGLGTETGFLITGNGETQFSQFLEANHPVVTPPVSQTIDLRGIALSATNELTAGDRFTVSYQLQNEGTGNAENFRVAFYLSSDSTITTSDRLLGFEDFSSLAANTSTNLVAKTLSLPGATDAFWTGSRSYFIGMVVDSLNTVNETNEGNANRGNGVDVISSHVTVPAIVSLSATQTGIREDQSTQFTLTRTGNMADPLTVSYTIGGTATNGSDYSAIASSISFAAGSATAVVDLMAIDDTQLESNETVTLTLTSGTSYQLSSTSAATIAITDNDTVPEPGNTLATAQAQSAIFVQSDRVSSTDQSDIYRFTVNESGIFTATLSSLTGDADVRLIRDVDNDGAIDTAKLFNSGTGILDQGEILAWQWERGTASESIRRFLSAGTYFVQVMSYHNQTANYHLSTHFTAAASDDRQFSIVPTFSSSLNATAKATIQKAIDFWMNAIPATTFATAQPFSLTIAEDASITGDVLAEGSYTTAILDANGRMMPTAGRLDLSVGYLNTLNAIANTSPDVIIHEMIHALGGVGFLNSSDVNGAQATYNANTYAGWAYGELKGSFMPTAIPLTQHVGEGSDLTHWNEAVFGNEMMTHATTGAPAVLSVLSLAALRDIGWAVNFGVAQPYALPIGGINPTLTTIVDDRGTVNPGSSLSSGSFSYAVNSELTDRLHRVQFNGIGALGVTLSNLTANADLQIIYDANNNSVVDSGEVIATANNSGTTSESLNLSNLNAGVYYINVYATSAIDSAGNQSIASTNYTLRYDKLAASQAPITTSLSPVEHHFGSLGRGVYNATNNLYTSVVGDRNIDDLFRFNFGGTTSLTFSLTGLTDNADFRLIRDANSNGAIDSGEVIAIAASSGSQSETISASNLAAGDYYFHVYRAGTTAATSYSLNLNSLVIS